MDLSRFANSSKWPHCSAIQIISLWRKYELSDNEPRNVVDNSAAHPEDDADLLQPQMFQQLADYIRDRAGVLTQAADDQAQEEAKLGMYVQWLERCVHATSADAAEETMFEHTEAYHGHYFKHLGRHAKYFSEFFVKVIVFAMHLHDDNRQSGSYVGQVFHKAVRLLPRQVQKLMQEMYQNQAFPSSATISRANLYVDVAFMRLMQDRHDLMITNRCIFFGLSDASPISGRLYQISEYFSIGDIDDPSSIDRIGCWTSELRCFPKNQKT